MVHILRCLNCNVIVLTSMHPSQLTCAKCGSNELVYRGGGGDSNDFNINNLLRGDGGGGGNSALLRAIRTLMDNSNVTVQTTGGGGTLQGLQGLSGGNGNMSIWMTGGPGGANDNITNSINGLGSGGGAQQLANLLGPGFMNNGGGGGAVNPMFGMTNDQLRTIINVGLGMAGGSGGGGNLNLFAGGGGGGGIPIGNTLNPGFGNSNDNNRNTLGIGRDNNQSEATFGPGIGSSEEGVFATSDYVSDERLADLTAHLADVGFGPRGADPASQETLVSIPKRKIEAHEVTMHFPSLNDIPLSPISPPPKPSSSLSSTSGNYNIDNDNDEEEYRNNKGTATDTWHNDMTDNARKGPLFFTFPPQGSSGTNRHSKNQSIQMTRNAATNTKTKDFGSASTREADIQNISNSDSDGDYTYSEDDGDSDGYEGESKPLGFRPSFNKGKVGGLRHHGRSLPPKAAKLLGVIDAHLPSPSISDGSTLWENDHPSDSLSLNSSNNASSNSTTTTTITNTSRNESFSRLTKRIKSADYDIPSGFIPSIDDIGEDDEISGANAAAVGHSMKTKRLLSPSNDFVTTTTTANLSQKRSGSNNKYFTTSSQPFSPPAHGQSTWQADWDLPAQMLASEAVPKGATMNWLRHHGFAIPWDPLFVVLWAGLLSCGFGAFTILRSSLITNSTDNAASSTLHIIPHREFMLSLLYTIVCPAYLVAVLMAAVTSLTDTQDSAAKASPHLRNSAYSMQWGLDVIDSLTQVCRVCSVKVSTSTHHCKRCNKCVSGFDHHCRWLNCCIGRSNYKPFIALLSSGMISATTSWGLATVSFYYYVRQSFKNSSGGDDGEPSNPFVSTQIGLSIFLALITIVVACLLSLSVFHLKLWWYGLSTYEYIQQQQELEQQNIMMVNSNAYLSVDVEDDLHEDVGNQHNINHHNHSATNNRNGFFGLRFAKKIAKSLNPLRFVHWPNSKVTRGLSSLTNSLSSFPSPQGRWPPTLHTRQFSTTPNSESVLSSSPAFFSTEPSNRNNESQSPYGQDSQVIEMDQLHYD
ncbi:hypothetical protein H4219_006027 [Mycoemilia scoparia]|uniref:Palmitoyltransferase DHHC domain-containing protein n=1 Tax=Mycoemilia scoparia TaxID=417184 RepID=A0A9W7ZM01_9FUNG|nr:hypothetical protein H4219_006027 [Mycoemilia scoparia]